MVPDLGFEPEIYRASTGGSAIELIGHFPSVERPTRFERATYRMGTDGSTSELRTHLLHCRVGRGGRI